MPKAGLPGSGEGRIAAAGGMDGWVRYERPLGLPGPQQLAQLAGTLSDIASREVLTGPA